jgi:hypothetical protein
LGAFRWEAGWSRLLRQICIFFVFFIAEIKRFWDNEVMNLTLKHPIASRIRANLILSIGSKKERKDVCAWYSVNEEWTAKKEVKKWRGKDG